MERHIALFILLIFAAGCNTHHASMGDAGTSAPDATTTVSREFVKIDSFVRGDARIAPGQTPSEVCRQLSKGKTTSLRKSYAFGKPEPEMLERNVWVINYGPEVPGMGRVDVLRISFKDDKVSKLEHKAYACP